MPKAIILVTDMPSSCYECDMLVGNNVVCVTNERFNFAMSRPAGCPLKPMPEKVELSFVDHGQDQIAMGWNACIDKIIEEGEQ